MQLNSLLLLRHGVPGPWVPLALTISQSSEIATLALLPWILGRLGLKPTLVLGLAAWTVGLTILCVGEPTWLVLLSLASNGFYITCFLVAGQLFVNRQAHHDIRASVQGMIQLAAGSGQLLGHLLVGVIREQTHDNFTLTFAPAAAIALGLFVLFVFGFRVVPAAPAADSLEPGADVT
jgi:fucose permease